MLVAHVSCYVDPTGSKPRELLRLWPTLTEVAAAAAGDGVEIVVVQAASQDDLVNHNGVQCHFVSDHGRSVLFPRRLVASRRPGRLGAKLGELAPDVVHLHGLSFLRQASFLAGLLPGTPILVQDHADRPPRRRTLFSGHRPALDIAGVCFTSRELCMPWIEAGWLDPQLPVFEILESSSHFTVGDQDAARAATGLFGDPCLVWVGRLSQVKDPLTVLDALAQAIPQLRDPHLWCYYTQAPLHREVTRRLENDDRLARRTHLQGPVPHAQIEAVMRAADFFVTGSRREGSGYAVIEAMACGTPPIVTDIPAFRSLTGGCTVGALVPPGDPSAMALALTEWSSQDRRSLRSMVRAHFDRTLSFEVLGGKLRAAYRKLAGVA